MKTSPVFVVRSRGYRLLTMIPYVFIFVFLGWSFGQVTGASVQESETLMKFGCLAGVLVWLASRRNARSCEK